MVDVYFVASRVGKKRIHAYGLRGTYLGIHGSVIFVLGPSAREH